MNLYKLTQSGRSMVEMLGVLVIIGVLSITGILGYQFALNKYRANDLIHEINGRAVTASIQKMQGLTPLMTDEWANQTKQGYKVSTYLLPYDARFFEIDVAQVPVNVCKAVLRSDWRLPVQIFVDEKEYNGTIDLCEQGTDFVPMGFIFYEDLQGSILPPRVCKTDVECDKCESCVNGLCENPAGLIYYHGECLSGQPCSGGATWDAQQNACICSSGVYVLGLCQMDPCKETARWHAELQQCICLDETKAYNDLTKTCEDNTCPAGEVPSYFWEGTLQKVKCCPVGQKAANINEKGWESTNGYCCPPGYGTLTPPYSWGGYTFKKTLCVRSLCDQGTLTTYYRGGENLPICCDEGVSAAMVSSDGKLYENGVCCNLDETVYVGDNYSYCVKKECPFNEVLLTVDYGKCGGAGRPFLDEIPICCPKGVTAAARCNEKGQCSSYGYCCQPGSKRIFTDCSSSCVIETCPVDQQVLTYKKNYAAHNVCCPLEAPGAAYFDSHGKGYNEGVCCQPGETAFDGAYGKCSAGPQSCRADEELADYFQDAWLKMCCPKGVTAAYSWAHNAAPVCCQPGEKSVRSANYGSACVPAVCPNGETRFYFNARSFNGSYPMEKCCGAGSPGAAYCNSDGSCNDSGYCCNPDEKVVSSGSYSVCTQMTCSGQTPKRYTYQYDGQTFEKCCPANASGAAATNALSAVSAAGYCCGPNEIVNNNKCASL